MPAEPWSLPAVTSGEARHVGGACALLPHARTKCYAGPGAGYRSSARTVMAKFLLGGLRSGVGASDGRDESCGAWRMFQLRKVVQVAREELDFDPRRVAAGVCSGMLPQNSFHRVRTMLLRGVGLQIGATSLFGGAVHITGSGALRDMLAIGPGCYITGPVHIDLSAPVCIGARVYIGHQVRLLTVDHEIGDSAQRCGPRVYRAIDIEDGVWIGSCAVILPGVRLGRGSVVAAGALVTRDVPPNVMVGGVPARPMRDLEDGVAREAWRERMATPLFSPGRRA
jgi:maltose O-acetyltransferase